MKLPRLKIADEIERRLNVIKDLLAGRQQTVGFIAQQLYKTINANGRIFVAGNGGSAAEADHFVAELVGRYKIERISIDARNLCASAATLTAIGNDFGFDKVFSRQLEGQFQDGDIAFFFSTSGNSPNVIEGLRCLRPGSQSVLFAGNDGGAAKPHAKSVLIIESDDTAIIQECHLMLVHLICDLVERKLQQEPDSRFQYQA